MQHKLKLIKFSTRPPGFINISRQQSNRNKISTTLKNSCSWCSKQGRSGKTEGQMYRCLVLQYHFTYIFLVYIYKRPIWLRSRVSRSIRRRFCLLKRIRRRLIVGWLVSSTMKSLGSASLKSKPDLSCRMYGCRNMP